MIVERAKFVVLEVSCFAVRAVRLQLVVGGGEVRVLMHELVVMQQRLAAVRRVVVRLVKKLVRVMQMRWK